MSSTALPQKDFFIYVSNMQDLDMFIEKTPVTHPITQVLSVRAQQADVNTWIKIPLEGQLVVYARLDEEAT